MIRPLISLCLALILALTGGTLATARGAMPAAGVVVLCSGGGILVVPVDASGNPTGPAQVCPDIALSLIAASAPPAPALLLPPGLLVETLRPAPTPAAPGLSLPVRRARGPPHMA